LNDTTNFFSLYGGSNTPRLPSDYNYFVDVKFIPEPCTPDIQSPVGGSYSLSTTIDSRAAIDSGVSFTMNEPSMPTATAESYAYVVGDPKENMIDDPLNTGYIATGTTNQWGIHTGSITITLTYT
jgi:hypothetical protein